MLAGIITIVIRMSRLEMGKVTNVRFTRIPRYIMFTLLLQNRTRPSSNRASLSLYLLINHLSPLPLHHQCITSFALTDALHNQS